MISVVLYEPEIPQNTGNIIRLCANSGSDLHLIKPIGFSLENKKLIRAGLDYREFVNLKVHENFYDFYETKGDRKIWACTTKAKSYYHQVSFNNNDILVFGPETRGLPLEILDLFEKTAIKIPMHNNSRSLNLSNSVSIILYGAMSSVGFSSLGLL